MVLPKLDAMLKPDGTARFERFSVPDPLFVIVKVLVTAVPIVVEPKLNEPPSAMFPTPVSETAISGAVAAIVVNVATLV